MFFSINYYSYSFLFILIQVDRYSKELVEWFKKLEETFIQTNFRQKLNDILKDEKGIRKRRIVAEMAKNDDVIQARESDIKLFESYRRKEFSEDVSILS